MPPSAVPRKTLRAPGMQQHTHAHSTLRYPAGILPLRQTASQAGAAPWGSHLHIPSRSPPPRLTQHGCQPSLATALPAWPPPQAPYPPLAAYQSLSPWPCRPGRPPHLRPCTPPSPRPPVTLITTGQLSQRPPLSPSAPTLGSPQRPVLAGHGDLQACPSYTLRGATTGLTPAIQAFHLMVITTTAQGNPWRG